MTLKVLVLTGCTLVAAGQAYAKEYGRIAANATIVILSATSVRSDALVSYIPFEPHCASNCINELAGTHQLIQYGRGIIAGVNFRTSVETYRGSLSGTGFAQQCYYGIADEMTYTWRNPPPDWSGSPILAHRNDERSEVRCSPAVTVTQPSPWQDTGGTNPDGSKGDTPIIIDLQQNGYALTAPSAGVQFDIRNEGLPVRIAWTQPGSDDAFLALDRNGNGLIDTGAELFGNHTPSGSGVAANGFAALAELDQNGDQVVDANDAAWNRLLLWTDRNHDALTTPEELQPVSDSIIRALGTNYRQIGMRDRWGNRYRYVAQYRDRDGRDHRYYDVVLGAVPATP